MKNKKNYNKIFGLFLLIFICFSFFANTAMATYEYRNPDGKSSVVCQETLAACNTDLRTRCYASNLPVGNTYCAIVPGCSAVPQPVVCPMDITYIAGHQPPAPTDVYTLLAPIGELKTAPKDIGDYFNTIFLIAIGLCGALAVIMIVIGGIQYMGDESIFGKTKGKEQITSAILGLLIALGAYALLNTINPDLLGKGGVHIKQVSAEIEEAPMLNESSDIPPLETSINQCSEGLEKIQTNGVTMHLCKSISGKVKTMIALAWTQNIKLSGAAFRSKADQIKFRIANQCPDVYTSPASDCKPPTAIPGSSMHESGLAIDFRCNGQSIQAKDNECFIWLSQNAKTAGLINFAKEPWHWSTNGH